MTALANFRASFQDRMDGLCLLCLGGFMAALARSGLYWYFLNPKFSTLTLTAGALLSVSGLALLLKPQPGRRGVARLLRQTVLLGFLCLAATAWDQAAMEPEPGVLNPASVDSPAHGALQTPEPEASADPLPARGDTAYVRLNLAELYIMLDKGRTDRPERFALRALVQRPPGPAPNAATCCCGAPPWVCCLADSLELGFVAQGLNGAFNAVQDGEWVEVFGHLEALEPKGRDKGLTEAAPKGQGPSLAVTNPNFRIQAETVERIAPPGFPYLFEFREKPPFAWVTKKRGNRSPGPPAWFA